MALLALLVLALLATVAHSGVPHTVSGLSSGAYAAVQVRRCRPPLVPLRRARRRQPPALHPRVFTLFQYHVAYSSSVEGAGIVAGGPYVARGLPDDPHLAT